MKKIFLTSGIVACMACPAFADPGGYGFTDTSIDRAANGDLSANTSNTGNTVTDYAQISAHDVANACVVDIIGVTEGETTLRAKWANNYCKYNLDTNTAANGWNGSSSVAPTPIYGVNGDSTHMYTSTDSNGTLTGEKVVTDTILTSSPIGANVTYTPTANYPSYASTSATMDISPSLPSGGSNNAVTPAPRAFGGIYSAATGGTKYIDADGTLLQAGLNAAAQCTGTDPVTEYTWYAQYTCGTPTINTTNESSAYKPTMDGYHFLGWASTQPQYAATADEETETHLASLVDSNLPSCITENTPIYPVWAPETYEIEYRCGTTDISGNTIPGYNTVDNPVTARYYNDFPIYFDRTYTFRGADNCAAPTGYEFVEWDCSENNTTITHDADESISWQYQQGLRCTAKWRAKEYQVNYECYDTLGSISDYTNVAGYTGTPNVANTTATYNQNYQFQLSSNCPTPTGYVFDGWHCIPSDTNVAASNYGSGQQIMPWTNDYNLRCVAKWKGERITLHWNSNNGDPRTIADSSCTYTEQVGLPTNPTRTGFRFKGWEVVETPQEVQIPDAPVANP